MYPDRNHDTQRALSVVPKQLREQVHEAIRRSSHIQTGTRQAVDRGAVLLVGSVVRPNMAWTVEDVLRACARQVGGLVSMLPDGEVGDRANWIGFLPKRIYSRHAGLRRLSSHPDTGSPWLPDGADRYNRHQQYEVAEPGMMLHFDDLGYATEAIASYRVFRALRDCGAIPAHVRFQVGLPGPESATRPFVRSGRDFEVLWGAYVRAMQHELIRMREAIPAHDLAVQWDLARETAACEGAEFNFLDSDLQSLPQDPFARLAFGIRALAPAVPAGAWLGAHVCYGSLGHQDGRSADSAHYMDFDDLGTAVRMLNTVAQECGRRLDYVHTPVQLHNRTTRHYRPLADLDIGDARLYLGLVDPHDGVEGARERIALASQVRADFGIATACGWGRRPANETVTDLLALNAAASTHVPEAAAPLTGQTSQKGNR